MIKNKSFFGNFGKEVEKEHRKFEAYQKKTDFSNRRCDHYGKVKMVNGEIRCQCGVGWSGSGSERLFDLFMRKSV